MLLLPFKKKLKGRKEDYIKGYIKNNFIRDNTCLQVILSFPLYSTFRNNIPPNPWNKQITVDDTSMQRWASYLKNIITF